MAGLTGLEPATSCVTGRIGPLEPARGAAPTWVVHAESHAVSTVAVTARVLESMRIARSLGTPAPIGLGACPPCVHRSWHAGSAREVPHDPPARASRKP